MDHSRSSFRPCSSSSAFQIHDPMSFGSSSLTTASPFTSSPSTGSTYTDLSFNTNSLFRTPTQSPSFYTNQSPNTSSSSTLTVTSPPYTNASSRLSPFASNSNNNSPSPRHNVITTPRSSSPPNRLKSWKNRDNGKSSSSMQVKARRDEVLARFRGINLSKNEDNSTYHDDGNETDADDDFYASLVDPGANDPAWSWDAMCNKEIESQPIKQIPWYVLDQSLSWEEFLHYCNQDSWESGPSYNQTPFSQNEQMSEPDEDRIDDKEIDPWAETKSEIHIEHFINENDPETMLCPYCKQYSFQKVGPTSLECANCSHPHIVRPTTTILMLKHRMIESFNAHRSNCSSHFSNYTLNQGNIILICSNCDTMYNISGDL